MRHIKKSTSTNDVQDLHFVRIEEAASRLDMSARTLERLIAAGEGPTVTALSVRRRRIRLDHLRAWADARAVVNAA